MDTLTKQWCFGPAERIAQVASNLALPYKGVGSVIEHSTRLIRTTGRWYYCECLVHETPPQSLKSREFEARQALTVPHSKAVASGYQTGHPDGPYPLAGFLY
jgi:hypothetical protein